MPNIGGGGDLGINHDRRLERLENASGGDSLTVEIAIFGDGPLPESRLSGGVQVLFTRAGDLPADLSGPRI
jgi:hypothetical protein